MKKKILKMIMIIKIMKKYKVYTNNNINYNKLYYYLNHI
jgi:hypothetical protein